MTSKEFLEQAFVLSRDIKAHMAELDRLSEISTASGAISYDNDRVISSVPQQARFESTVVKLVDLRNDIRKEIFDLLEKHREIRDVICQVTDEEVRTVLRMRYLAGKSITEVADELKLSKRTVLYRLDSGYHEVSLITGYPEPMRQRMPARDRHAESRRILRDFHRNDHE